MVVKESLEEIALEVERLGDALERVSARIDDLTAQQQRIGEEHDGLKDWCAEKIHEQTGVSDRAVSIARSSMARARRRK